MSNDVLDDFNDNEKRDVTYLKRFLNILFYFIAFLVGYGLFARLMYWPYSRLALIASLGFAVLWFAIYMVNKYTRD